VVVAAEDSPMKRWFRVARDEIEVKKRKEER
jgi:hypothetical protein